MYNIKWIKDTRSTILTFQRSFTSLASYSIKERVLIWVNVGLNKGEIGLDKERGDMSPIQVNAVNSLKSAKFLKIHLEMEWVSLRQLL